MKKLKAFLEAFGKRMPFNLQAFFENLDKKLNETITITYQPKDDIIRSTAELDLQLDGLEIDLLPTQLVEKSERPMNAKKKKK